MSKILIYIVDDDPSICRSLALLLKTYNYAVETFAKAEDFLAFKHPRVKSCLVLDIKLPGINGLDLQEMMTAKKLEIPIVFLTGHGDVPKSVKAIKAGAVDFLVKPFTSKEKVLEAVLKALDKSQHQIKKYATVASIQKRINTLSPKELEVFHFVVQGLMNKQIASRRGITLQTVKVQRGRVMQKMQAKTLTELIKLAQKAGLTTSLD